MKSVSEALATEAVKALKAIGLDYGAVDCCVDPTGKPWIIEVNSGPGLEESTFNTWVVALKDKAKDILFRKRKVPEIEKAPEKAPMMAKVTLDKTNKKSALLNKLELAQQMVECAEDSEAEILDKVFARMFGK
jgi:hypothetical protein